MTAPLANFHEAFMRRALELARCAWGETHPNPLVGALVVEDGQIVAEGFHAKAGEPHAEIVALRALDESRATGRRSTSPSSRAARMAARRRAPRRSWPPG